MNKSEIMRRLIEKFSVAGDKNYCKYYVLLDVRYSLGTIKLTENSEKDEELLKKMNEFLKSANCRATFGGVNLYIMSL